MRQSLIDHLRDPMLEAMTDEVITGKPISLPTIAVDALVEWIRENHPYLVLDVVFKTPTRDTLLALADLLEAP